MSVGRKRMAWRRIANRSGSVRDRLDLKVWRRGGTYGLNGRKTTMRKWMIGFCLMFFILLTCSAAEHGRAYKSPVLNGIGIMACVVVKAVLILGGSVVWCLVKDKTILEFALEEFPAGHHGVFRIFLGTVLVTIGLYTGGMRIAEKYSRSDEWTAMFLKVLGLLYLIALIGMLCVFYRRCSAALVKTYAADVQTISVADGGAYAPELPAEMGGPSDSSEHVLIQTKGEFLRLQRKDLYPERYADYRRTVDSGLYSGVHMLCQDWWDEHVTVEVLDGEIVEPEQKSEIRMVQRKDVWPEEDKSYQEAANDGYRYRIRPSEEIRGRWIGQKYRRPGYGKRYGYKRK